MWNIAQKYFLTAKITISAPKYNTPHPRKDAIAHKKSYAQAILGPGTAD